jgi:hypothetical protein
MSLWTPSGEHHVDPDDHSPAGADPSAGRRAPAVDEADDEPMTAEAMADLRRQLADAPPEVVLANHCYGLFELAAVYLSQVPPLLPQAQLAIDALGYLVGGLGPRLGAQTASLQEALAQIRLAYVQMDAAAKAASSAPTGVPAANGSDTPD